MNEEVFERAYKTLNERQKEAVDATEGPIMVVAGPGTGKTQIIALRVAQILKTTDTPPDGILVLTFTESGVTAIKKRLAGYIGQDAYRVHVHTFHGFCNTSIQENPDQFPRIIGGEHVDDIRRIEALRSILTSNSFSEIKPLSNVDFYVDKVSRTIRELKREGYTPNDFERLVSGQAKDFGEIEDLYHEKGKYKGQMKGKYALLERKIKKNRDLLKIFREYDTFLRENNLYDYEDMVLEVLTALETDNDFLLSLQESYLYILADEHQDANESQNRLLFLLSSFYEEPNLFVVGDDKQAIYRFQGASLKNFLSFTKRFPNVKTIELTENYRSTEPVISASFRLISHSRTLSENVLESNTSEKGVLSLKVYDREDHETDGIAEAVERLIENGSPAAEIAVLVRRNKDIDPLKRALSWRGVPLSLKERFDENPFARNVLTYLRAVNEPANDVFVAGALFAGFLNLPPKETSIAINQAQKERSPLIASEFAHGGVMKALKTITDLHALSKNEDLLDTLDVVFKRSDMVTYALEEQDSASLDILDVFFSLARNYSDAVNGRADLEGFLSHLDTAKEFGIDLPQLSGTKDGVRVITAHRSKGLEFDTVFVPRLDAAHWGARGSRDFFHIPELKALGVSEEEDPLADERRLLFVAMTRARKNLFLSYSTESTEGKELMPSPFVEEIDLKQENGQNGTTFERFEAKLHTNGRSAEKAREDFIRYIQDRFDERGLTATSINNYLTCPNKFVFQNLLQLPQAESTSAQFGTAIHAALQFLFESVRKGQTASEDEVLAVFTEKIRKASIDETVRSELIERGTNALSGYIKTYGSEWPTNIENEKKIRTSIETDSGDITLAGKLDRVEMLDSGHATVTDYKTGKVKSANHIEGKTKDSTGNYKRQLVFYALLLERIGVAMKEGVIDFIEPNERGKHKRHAFSISSEEKEELVATINSIADNMRNGSFVSATCGEDDCRWCELRSLIAK